MPLSDEDVKRIASEIVTQFFKQIDYDLGKGLRKKLVYIVIAGIIVGAISVGVIKLPEITHTTKTSISP